VRGVVFPQGAMGGVHDANRHGGEAARRQRGLAEALGARETTSRFRSGRERPSSPIPGGRGPCAGPALPGPSRAREPRRMTHVPAPGLASAAPLKELTVCVERTKLETVLQTERER